MKPDNRPHGQGRNESMDLLVRILMLAICIYQMVLSVAAEKAGSYPEAIYELLWAVLFTHLIIARRGKL